MIWMHYDSRKIHREKNVNQCTMLLPSLSAVLFASRCLLIAGFGTRRAICQLGFGEQDVAAQTLTHHQPQREVPVLWSEGMNKD